MALSRVRVKDDVRLLLRNGDRSTMNYIKDLKKNDMVKSFFKGYIPKDESMDDGLNQRPEQVLMKWHAQTAIKDHEAASFVPPDK